MIKSKVGIRFLGLSWVNKVVDDIKMISRVKKFMRDSCGSDYEMSDLFLTIFSNSGGENWFI